MRVVDWLLSFQASFLTLTTGKRLKNMTNRKKRLQKGIESLDKQIKIHEEKRKQAIEEGKIELADYYDKEILSKSRDKDKKISQRNK